jgi:hypothetical protein
MTSILYISTATEPCDIVSRWLPIVTTSTRWILVNQILLLNHPLVENRIRYDVTLVC